MLAGLAAFITSVVSSVFARELLMKIFLRGIIMAAVPVAILIGFNFVLKIMIDTVTAALNNQNVGDLTVVNLSGLGLYLCQELGVVQAVYMIVAAFGVKLALRSIPFVKL